MSLLFHIAKTFAGGGVDKKVHLQSAILNPNVCPNPRAAQFEFMKCKDDVKRWSEFQCHPPVLLLAYRATESIFSAVVDKAEPLLNARWVTLRSQSGLPHHVNLGTIEEVAAFADAELGALVLHGGSGLNIGLQLTIRRLGHSRSRRRKRRELQVLEENAKLQLNLSNRLNSPQTIWPRPRESGTQLPGKVGKSI